MAIGPEAVIAIYDDNRTGSLETGEIAVLNAVAERASRRVDARVVRAYDGPFPMSPVPALVKDAALEFFVAFSFERHPEYVRAHGADEHQKRLDRAEQLCEEIADAIRYLTELVPPKTAGGIVYDNGPRFSVDSLDGTSNRGDF